MRGYPRLFEVILPLLALLSVLLTTFSTRNVPHPFELARAHGRNVLFSFKQQHQLTAAAGYVLRSAEPTDSLERAMNEVVRILLKDSSEVYIQEHAKFSFYIYELPVPFSWEYVVDDCLERMRTARDTCDWGMSICSYSNTPTTTFSKKRLNFNADVALAKLLTEYNGKLRTYNPQTADVLIVPYPFAALRSCAQHRQVQVADELLGELQFWNKETAHKHLFLSSTDPLAYKPRTQIHLKAPLIATLGHVQKACRAKANNCGQFVIPYMNTNEEYQPNRVGLDFWKPVEKRDFAVAAMYNVNISGNGQPRALFLAAVNQHLNTTDGRLAGLPIHVRGSLGPARQIGSEKATLELYRNSIFCPILRGDEPPQKRFFDVMMSGCIPVVLEGATTNDPLYPSHFAVGKTPSIRWVYPFSTGTFAGNDRMGIEYRDIVVGVNATCGAPCILPVLEKLLLNDRKRLQKMQSMLGSVVSLFTYGLEANSRRYPDALAAALVKVRHYIHSYQERKWVS